MHKRMHTRDSVPRLCLPADGVAIKLPGAEPFRLCRELLDGVTLVDNSAISTAIKARAHWGSGWLSWGRWELSNAACPALSAHPACPPILHAGFLPHPQYLPPANLFLGNPFSPLPCRMCSTRRGPSWSPRALWRWREPSPSWSTTDSRVSGQALSVLLCGSAMMWCIAAGNALVAAAQGEALWRCLPACAPARLLIPPPLTHLCLPAGKNVVCVTSGANMNFDRLRLVSGACSGVQGREGRAGQFAMRGWAAGQGGLASTKGIANAWVCWQPPSSLQRPL